MSKVFTPEKVRELAFQLKYCTSAEREEALTLWLEQNQPEPVVVGLRTKTFARSHQFTPHWANWVAKDGSCFWHE